MHYITSKENYIFCRRLNVVARGTYFKQKLEKYFPLIAATIFPLIIKTKKNIFYEYRTSSILNNEKDFNKEFLEWAFNLKLHHYCLLIFKLIWKNARFINMICVF